jgi:hypothetical protein
LRIGTVSTRRNLVHSLPRRTSEAAAIGVLEPVGHLALSVAALLPRLEIAETKVGHQVVLLLLGFVHVCAVEWSLVTT